MGRHQRHNSAIIDFEPDDTDDEFYVPSDVNVSIPDLLGRIHAKWGADVDLDRVVIEAQHIHTHCLGYDKYDPGDYTDYLVIKIDKS